MKQKFRREREINIIISQYVDYTFSSIAIYNITKKKKNRENFIFHFRFNLPELCVHLYK